MTDQEAKNITVELVSSVLELVPRSDVKEAVNRIKALIRFVADHSSNIVIEEYRNAVNNAIVDKISRQN